jgi:hypothetical protein
MTRICNLADFPSLFQTLNTLPIHNTIAPLEETATDMVWPIEFAYKLLTRIHSLLQV